VLPANQQSRLRLVCFPYAGAGPSALRNWAKALPAFLESRFLLLPGRERLLREAPFTEIAPLVEWAVERDPATWQAPFALFGHSMGALIAFEVARRLRRTAGPLPLCLVVSGRIAPQWPDPIEPIHALPYEQFRARLRDLQGTPPGVLDNEELMTLFTPMLRADFQVCETYRYTPEPPLACPIIALGSAEDETTPVDALRAWREQTSSRFAHHLFPGGHFFLHTQTQAMIETMAAEIHACLQASSQASP
jgi:medium-chain acyl-[acyl-carrier-protein] hydrolase